MFTQGIFPIGDGLLDINEERLKGLLVPHDINEIYDVEQTPFARGKFAAVRRAVHKNSGVHFAAKFLKRRRRAQSSDKEIKHEIAVLMVCDGADNIVKLNAVHETRSDTALLLELATGGELQSFLDNEECLNEAQARTCMREVLKALQFLHKRSIVHLDLKPQNILLNGERIEDGLKLCDFGISRVVTEGTNVREIVGTPDYVAPEVLQYEPLSLSTDIWSVGVLAYVLLSGFSPFGGDTKQETFLNISQCALTFPDKLFRGVSSAAIDFIRRSLRIKPNDRMTAAGCLEHIWLKDEVSIDRQIFNNISTKTSANADDQVHNGSLHDAEDDEDEEEEDEEEQEIEIVDDVEDEVEEYENSTNNEMDSYEIEHDVQHVTSNGSSQKLLTTTTTTAIHTVPAMRATTIPLYSMQPQQQQYEDQTHQQQYAGSRRHSSDSNKENTYLTTKKIMPTNNIKKSSNATATIIIAPSDLLSSAESSIPTNCVATITLPNGSTNYGENNTLAVTGIATQCLFPDAPTTPKVIRKASNADSSPTSVKALVKKFQLEGNNTKDKQNTSTATAHLKETQSSNTQKNQQSISSSSSCSSRRSSSLSSSGKTCSTKISETNNNVRNINVIRRASEPHTVATHEESMATMTNGATNGTAMEVVTSYKSNCVFCLPCGSSNSNTTTTTSTANGCRHPVVSNHSVTENSISTSPTSNGTKSSATAAALLFSSHQQLRHHHHHHHHVAKNTTTNLSLDQGIIC